MSADAEEVAGSGVRACAAPAKAGFAFPRAARITTDTEIRTLFRRGKRRKTRHLDVFFSPSPVSRPRIGFVVPKPRARTAKALARDGRVRAPAVHRNRLKRRLREIGRTTILPVLWAADAPLDVLIRARPEAYGTPFTELRTELARATEELCSRAR